MIARLLRIAVAALCVLAAGRAFAQEPVQPPSPRPAVAPASISGVVLKLPNLEPAAGATVKILDESFGAAPPGAQTHRRPPRRMSFVFDSLKPGNYFIVANLPGFMPTEYGRRSATGQGTSIAVSAGRRLAGVRLPMTPTGTISGRVFDEDGEPAGRVQVLALRMIYRDGQPAMTIAQSVVTNDRGEYRLFWLPPASYRIAAKPWFEASNYPAVNIGPPRRFGTQKGTPPVLGRRALEDGAVVEETYRPMYAPGTTNPQTAQTVTLAPAESASADIQLAGNRVRAYHVRGVVANLRGEQTRFPPQVTIVPRVQSPMLAIPSATVRADGSFDVSGVPAGAYILYVQQGEGVLPIEVGDASLDNLVVTTTSGLTINGRISVDRGTSAGPVDLSGMRIVLERDPDIVGAPSGGPAFNPPAEADGTFTIGGVTPGDYRVSIPPILARPGELAGRAGGFAVHEILRNAFVKSIRWGRADVLAEGLHTWTAVPGPLDVVIGLSGAEVEGTARQCARAPAVNVVVVAVPEGENRGRGDLLQGCSTDRSGRFQFRGGGPGDYTVFTWYDVEPGAWQNAEFLRAYEGRGCFVRLREGQNDPLSSESSRDSCHANGARSVARPFQGRERGKGPALFAILLLLIAPPVAAQTPRPAGAALLQGIVVKWGTAEPVARARVELRRIEAGTPAPFVATTTADGLFRFGGVPPGQYRVVAMRPGYVNGEFGQRSPNGTGLPVTLAAGQAAVSIQVALTPTAAISGRIRDRFDQSIGNVEIRALKATYQDGRRTLTTVASAHSDDRGEYRLFWLPPGRYYLSARHPDIGGGMMRIGGFRLSGGRGQNGFEQFNSSGDLASASPIDPLRERQASEQYMLTYFPGGFDQQSALPIDLAPGAELAATDFTIDPVPRQRVRGRVVYETNGEPAMSARIQWLSSSGSSGDQEDPVFPFGPQQGVSPACCDGAFEAALAPGAYTLVAAVNNLS